MIRTGAVLLALTMGSLVFAASKATPPTVDFARSGVTIGGYKPGTKLAWMALVREPTKGYWATRIIRGFGPITPNSTFAIEHPEADLKRSIWMIADVDAGTGRHAKSPTMAHSSRGIVIRATPGAAVIQVDSSAIELMYVRPRFGAWSFSVADGGTRDADLSQNGQIVIPLQSLISYQGNPHPPATVETGDLLLVIDPNGMRTATLEVER